MARQVLIRGGCVLTMDPRIGDFDRADLLIDGSMIAEVAPHIDAPGAEIVEADAMIVIPGLVNTHHHMWQGSIRNVAIDYTIGEYFAKFMSVIAPRFTPADVYAGDLMSALEGLNAGVTTFLDWCHVPNSPEHADEAVRALKDSGARAVFAYGPPLGQGVREWFYQSRLTHPEDVRRMRRQYFASNDQLVTFALALRGPDFTLPEVNLHDFALARELAAPITMHIGAQGGAPDGVLKLKRANLLGGDINHVHVTISSDEELRMIADSGGTVSVTPIAEMMMGVGAPVTGRLLAAGVRPGLGIDTLTGSSGDMFGQMRAALAMERMTEAATIWARGEQYSSVQLTARQVLELATLEGARTLWLDSKIGSLTPGKQADVVLLRADELNMAPITGARSAVSAVVMNADTANVDSVFVAGSPLKRGGRMLADLDRARKLAAASSARLFEPNN
ncbi:MAG TPA: amidohydrolase family protein [Candidatus Binataceae bacterium]|nr:amidohydrolase family protein [Candidatus Binataceae bacterium]